MANPFESTENVKTSLSAQKYIASDEIATIVYLTQKLGKPLLTEGPADVGETKLAKAIIVGDGRNNYNDPRIGIFSTMSRRAARTIWLNPETSLSVARRQRHAQVCAAVQ